MGNSEDFRENDANQFSNSQERCSEIISISTESLRISHEVWGICLRLPAITGIIGSIDEINEESVGYALNA